VLNSSEGLVTLRRSAEAVKLRPLLLDVRLSGDVPEEPHHSLGGGFLALFGFVRGEFLQCFRLHRLTEHTLADFLPSTNHTIRTMTVP